MLRDKLEFVRKRIREYYDKYRLKGPRLKEGDKVFLLTWNLKIKRTSKKLDFKKVGPFKIIKKVITLNYELILPSSIRLRTNIFYVSLLKLAYKNAKFDTYIELEDFEEEFEVETVLNLRVSQGKLKYLIK